MQWKHFPRFWPFVRGIHRSPVNSPHKGQSRGALMFSLICAWIHGWVNNREAGDLRRYRAHCNVIVIHSQSHCCWWLGGTWSQVISSMVWTWFAWNTPLPFATPRTKQKPVLHSRYHSCWWPGSLRRHVINSHGIELVRVEYPVSHKHAIMCLYQHALSNTLYLYQHIICW